MHNVIEVGADGRRVALVTFDPDDLDAAYAEIDDRYAAGEGASSGTQLRMVDQDLAARDWDGLAARLAADIVVYDHRPVGWDTLRGPQAYVEILKALVDLAPDARTRVDHVRVCERGELVVSTLLGTRDGGAFEDPRVVVAEGDSLGRIRRIDFYTLDQFDEARVRFVQLGPKPSTPRIENAATRSMQRFKDASEACDWERVAAVLAPEFRYFDRRKMMHLDLDRQRYIEFLRPNWQMSTAGVTEEVLATRGDRLALFRALFEGSGRTIGPSEIEALAVAEVNDRGERVATVMFDPDDLDAAYAELDDRYAAGEAAAYGSVLAARLALSRAVAARDWPAVAEVLAADHVLHDHRPLGWETLHGPALYVESIKSLVDLAPHVRLRTDHLTIASARSSLTVNTWLGTREGGALETERVVVSERDALGRIRRQDLYNLEQLDEARVRLEAIGVGSTVEPKSALECGSLLPLSRSVAVATEGESGGKPPHSTLRTPVSDPLAALARFAELRPDPLRIPPNAATRASDRWLACIEARDWEALRALCAPIVYDDRRRLIRISGDCDMAVANSQLIAQGGARATRTLLATAGERLALQRILWTASDGSEIEVFEIIEVDAESRIVALIAFDPDDRRAASLEMFERYTRSDAARYVPARAHELMRALRDRDLDRMRAQLPNDFSFYDHRRTGAGRLGSAEEYVAFVAALFEQSPDVIIESLCIVAAEAHGVLDLGHMFGTRDGGEFESVFVRIMLYQGDRLVGAELFEPEGLDVARARFEELCAGLA